MRSPGGYLASCALSLALLGHAAAYSAPLCEEELKTVRALVGMIESSLRLGDVEADAVQSSLEGTRWKNPYTNAPNSIQNIAALKAFREKSVKLSPAQRDELRARISKMIAGLKVDSTKVDAAKEETADYIGLSVTEAIDADTTSGELAAGTFHGRPVFVHQMEYQGELGYYLIDPTLKDPAGKPTISMLIPLSSRPPGRQRDRSRIFQWQGRAYFMRLVPFPIIDLETKAEVKFNPHQTDELTVADPDTNLQDSTILVTEHTLRLVTTWYKWKDPDPDGTGELRFMDLVGTQTKQKLLGSGSSLLSELNELTPRQTIFPMPSSTNKKIVRFFELNGRARPVAQIKIEDDLSFSNKVRPIAFMKNEKRYGIVLRTNNYNFPRTLGLYDLERERFVKILNVRPANVNEIDSINLQEINGHPYAFMSFRDEFLVFDLVSEQVLWHAKEKLQPDVKYFRWKGRDYLLAITTKFEIQVREFENGNLLSRIQPPFHSAIDIHYFEDHGVPMAFALSGTGRKPFFLKLIDRLK